MAPQKDAWPGSKGHGSLLCQALHEAGRKEDRISVPENSKESSRERDRQTVTNVDVGAMRGRTALRHVGIKEKTETRKQRWGWSGKLLTRNKRKSDPTG